jgi:hypothetical protein
MWYSFNIISFSHLQMQSSWDTCGDDQISAWIILKLGTTITQGNILQIEPPLDHSLGNENII